MNTIHLWSCLAILVAIAITQPAGGQLHDTECQKAEVWHLQRALHYSHADAQLFHLQASEAARLLATLGTNLCSDWRTDAKPAEATPQGQVNTNA